ncbi:RING-H2 finger protein ATL46 [Morus notabilis]|uniref:RING-type E3 ubiquitin transferase n=1 Tax=Morus notabilis TaxID=981085 RepID=W9SX70_9ROSA|nr:RING-H2 finger protein ATL46 [Morus notabilis]
MSRIQLLQIQEKDGYMSYSPPFAPISSSPYTGGFPKESTPTSSSSSSSSSSGTRISPAVLFIIVILAVLFFISGLLHLLYKEIVGLKEPFDCAVCLCEFSEKDKLRLLPTCSHAFHISCIDTWLLSNSTCPLCRGTLFAPGYSIENPIFDFDDFREEDARSGNGGLVSSQKTMEIEETVVDKGVLPVRLGKFRRVNGELGDSGVGETSSSRLDARRCFSMGSYQYVLGDSVLRVALGNDQQGREVKPTKGPENGNSNPNVDGDLEGKKISSVSRGESYSVSKIWQWSKKGKFSTSTDAQIGMPSSLNMDLPWMEKAQGV